jgi:hypothetical protein
MNYFLSTWNTVIKPLNLKLTTLIKLIYKEHERANPIYPHLLRTFVINSETIIQQKNEKRKILFLVDVILALN